MGDKSLLFLKKKKQKTFGTFGVEFGASKCPRPNE